MKVFDIFYKKGKGKTKYAGSLWEGKFADDQRKEGKEPWLDVNLSTVIDGKRVYATAIEYGDKRLVLGKETGVYLKAGIVKGLTIAELDSDDFVDAEPGEPTAEEYADEEDADGDVDTSELE